jgi:hypothetical protein
MLDSRGQPYHTTILALILISNVNATYPCGGYLLLTLTLNVNARMHLPRVTLINLNS